MHKNDFSSGRECQIRCPRQVAPVQPEAIPHVMHERAHKHLRPREPFHLFRYLDEQSFRFNNRKLSDGERFSIVATNVVGRRLTYSELTGMDSERA